MQSTSLIVTNVNHVEVGQVEIPEPQSGEVLVRIDFSAISPGTELRCLRGEQSGQPPFPFIPGYAAIGRVVETGDDVDIPVGTRVLSQTTARASFARCWGGHCAYHVRPAASLVRLPEELSDADALMIRLAAIAYRGVRLAQPRPHESVVIIGLGPIGQCSARLFAATGARVVALDRVPERGEILQKSGIDARVVIDDFQKVVQDDFSNGFDVVVDATGAAAVALSAPRLLRTLPWNDEETSGPRYVVQGSYPGTLAFMQNELFTHEATMLFPRDSKRGDVEAVISRLQRHQITLGDIISEWQSPECADTVYQRLRDGEGGYLTAAFDWRA
jgi:2-desacetyl-2-hydroxyethyl bacteriochlorophyllide A dehydrogenase